MRFPLPEGSLTSFPPRLEPSKAIVTCPQSRRSRPSRDALRLPKTRNPVGTTLVVDQTCSRMKAECVPSAWADARRQSLQEMSAPRTSRSAPQGNRRWASWRTRGPRPSPAHTTPESRSVRAPAAICSDSLAGTRGIVQSLGQSTSGAAISWALCNGAMPSRKARMWGSRSSPYSARRKVAAVRLRVLEEGDEVADAHPLNAGADALREVHHRGEHHVAAVGTAGHRDAVCGQAPAAARSSREARRCRAPSPLSSGHCRA